MTPQPAHLLLADPPWKFGDKLPGKTRGAERNYKCLTPKELAAFPLPPIAPDAILLLWRVASMQQEALSLARAWGFVVKSEIVWLKLTGGCKRHFGMGRYVRAEHEVCLIGARGQATSLVKNHRTRSTFQGPTGLHSEKPAEFYALVEDLFEGPRCELFARKRRAGWIQFGDELPDS
jgi:N6-adenosine-specific RNA methylase IME4